jgi:hypothetical protein
MRRRINDFKHLLSSRLSFTNVWPEAKRLTDLLACKQHAEDCSEDLLRLELLHVLEDCSSDEEQKRVCQKV